jgi:hypothetical protein
MKCRFDKAKMTSTSITETAWLTGGIPIFTKLLQSGDNDGGNETFRMDYSVACSDPSGITQLKAG